MSKSTPRIMSYKYPRRESEPVSDQQSVLRMGSNVQPTGCWKGSRLFSTFRWWIKYGTKYIILSSKPRILNFPEKALSLVSSRLPLDPTQITSQKSTTTLSTRIICKVTVKIIRIVMHTTIIKGNRKKKNMKSIGLETCIWIWLIGLKIPISINLFSTAIWIIHGLVTHSWGFRAR